MAINKENTELSSETRLPSSPSLELDPKAEAALLRKLDIHIIPVLFIIYFLCYLDRSNIGNAKIQGMTQDLELDVGSRYNIALFVS